MAQDALAGGPLPLENEVAAPEPAEAVPSARADLRLGRAFLYSSGNMGASIFYAFNNYILSNFLYGLGAPPVLLGLLSSTHSFEGSVIQPLVGAWSDRTWWKHLGRRRPFIVVAAPLSALFLVATAFVPQLHGLWVAVGLNPTTSLLAALAVGVFLFSLLFNVAYDPYQSLLADITTPRQRGHVNGIFQALGVIVEVVFLFASSQLFGFMSTSTAYTVLFLATAGALVVFFIPTVLGIREPRQLVAPTVRQRYRLRDYWIALTSERHVLMYFGAQFFLWFGINSFIVYLTPYAQSVIHMSPGSSLILPVVLLGSSGIAVWPFGVLADRIGLKRIFLVGMLLMAGASIWGIFIHTVTPLFIALAVAGVGNAAQTGASYPLLTRIVRPDRMGLYTGLLSTVTSIAVPLSATLGGLIIGPAGAGSRYYLLFPFIAAMFLLALVPLALLNVRAGEAQVRAELAAAARSEISQG